jgi:hypothetical protein
MTDNTKSKPKLHNPHQLRVSPDLVLPNNNQSEPIEVAEVEPEETATAIVATGHSVHVSDGTRVACGYDALLSRPVYRQGFRIALPGETVELPKSEIEKLMALGYLIDPNSIEVVATDPPPLH